MRCWAGPPSHLPLTRQQTSSATTLSRIVDWGISGVVDLLGLSGGALLVLERAVVGGPADEPTVRIRIYEVDFAGATDVSRRPWASASSTQPSRISLFKSGY